MGVGAVLSQLGRNEEALAVWDALAVQKPASVEVWLNLGKTRALLKRIDCAEAFERVLALEPGHAEAGRLLAIVRQMR